MACVKMGHFTQVDGWGTVKGYCEITALLVAVNSQDYTVLGVFLVADCLDGCFSTFPVGSCTTGGMRDDSHARLDNGPCTMLFCQVVC